MGDPKKELGEDDFDKFDAKKSEAMGVFSEGNIFSSTEIYITQFTSINSDAGRGASSNRWG